MSTRPLWTAPPLARTPGKGITPVHGGIAIIDKPGIDRESITQRRTTRPRCGCDSYRSCIAFLGKAHLTGAVPCVTTGQRRGTGLGIARQCGVTVFLSLSSENGETVRSMEEAPFNRTGGHCWHCR
ncbi:TPA: hypothetical protein ACQ39K_004514 [Yersinia enterocolitica]